MTVQRHEIHARCHRRVRALLEAVDLPNPWDVNTFCDRLERHRGRDIDLLPVSWTLGTSSGAWQRQREHDVIAYADNTSGLHQDHIILHELGHMISQHRGRCVLSVTEAQHRAPDLSPAAFAHLLEQAHLEHEETEAEIIATMILTRIAQHQPRTAPRRDKDHPAGTEAVLTRIAGVFDRGGPA